MSNDREQVEEELEALRAIYTDLEILQFSETSVEIQLDNATSLSLGLSNGYPSVNPPAYTLCAPKMSLKDKKLIDQKFRDIWELNVGDPIIYQWIECLRDLIQQNYSEVDTSNEANEETETSETHEELEAECPEIHTGPCIEDRKSVFQGHFAKILEVQQVYAALKSLKSVKKIANATHNMWAYRFKGERGIVQDCDDDGETHAGSRLLHLLDILDCQNHLVVVTRWYGGIHLGPDRFKHINNAARAVMEEAQAIPDAKSKKKLDKAKR